MKTALIVLALVAVAVAVKPRSVPVKKYPPPFPTMTRPQNTDACVLYISTNKDLNGNPTQGSLAESLLPTGHEYYYQYFDEPTKKWVVVGWIPEQIVTYWLPKWH